jgi:hypothetical protein
LPGIIVSVFILVFIDQIIKFLLFSRNGNVMPVVSESSGVRYLDARILHPPVLVIVKDWIFIQPLLHKGHILQAYGDVCSQVDYSFGDGYWVAFVFQVCTIYESG